MDRALLSFGKMMFAKFISKIGTLVCRCIFIKFYITAQSRPVVLIILKSYSYVLPPNESSMVVLPKTSD